MQIVDTDAFLEMPVSSQLLYFHLLMRADDEGFIANPKRIMKMTGIQEDDLKILMAKRFILTFESGVVVIKHWLIHNSIRMDRFNPTKYENEKNSLYLKENKAYSEVATERQPVGNQMAGQVKLSEVKLSKDNLTQESGLVDTKPTPKEQAEKFFTNTDQSQIKVLTWLIEKGVPRTVAENELKKFINYWAELTPSGKKQKWQTKPTFEVSRRLATWFSNFDKFTKTRGNSGGQTAKI